MASVLVVEDSIQLQNLVRKVLTRAGHDVRVAGDGVQGLELIAKHAPDLLVLDIEMPRLDGYGVLRELRRRKLNRDTRILVLSGKNTEADWQRGYRYGAHQYLTKPVDVHELERVVEMLLEMPEPTLEVHIEREKDRAEILAQLERLLGEDRALRTGRRPPPPPPPPG